MAKTREIKRRITSVDNTRQITRTMEMVAATKIKRAQARIEEARPYAVRMRDMLANLVSYVAASEHPLLEVHEPIEKVLLVVMTSDRGLAGAFNANIIRRAENLYRREVAEGKKVTLSVVGKKGIGYFRHRGLPVVKEYTDLGDRPEFRHGWAVANDIIEMYQEKGIDRVFIVYNHFKSVMEQRTVEQVLFPIQELTDVEISEDQPRGEYLFEPDAPEMLMRLLPSYVQTLIFRSLLESAASEQGARRTAMKAATENAGDMIDLLTREFNRARQAQITQELSEIVGGAEALKHM